MAIAKESAGAAGGLTHPPTFSAPEGVYEETSLLVPFAELPLNGIAISVAANASNFAPIDSATPSASTGPGAGSASSTTSVASQLSSMASATSATAAASSLGSLMGPGPLLAASPNQASSALQTPNPSGNGTPTTLTAASQSTMTPMMLPFSWRKEVGLFVEPSISTCSIRWSGVATDPFSPTAGRGQGDSVGGQTDSSTGDSAAGSRSNPPSKSATDPQSSGGHGEHQPTANPLIEAALVAQGIDAPATRTTGGLGGLLGLSALASYGFLPSSDDALNLDRQLSLLSVHSERGLSSTYKPGRNVAKPKNAVRASNSSFVIKTQFHPDLKDILAQMEKTWDPMNPPESMAFTQRGRTLLWLSDTSSKKEPLARYLFSSPPSAHDVNQLTRSPSVLDVAIGFPTGDILWLDAIGMRYSRFNKGGIVTDSGIVQIRWLPSASNDGIFISAHVDGTMIAWDRDREDCEVNKGWSPRSWSLASTTAKRSGAAAQQRAAEEAAGAIAGDVSPGSRADGDDPMEVLDGRQGELRPGIGTRRQSNRSALSPNGPDSASRSTSPAKTARNRPVGPLEWDPKRSIIVSRPGMQTHTDSTDHSTQSPPFFASPDEQGGALGRSWRKEPPIPQGSSSAEQDTHGWSVSASASPWTKNPVTHWRVSPKRINAFAISPDLGCIAVVADDGLLKIIDLTTEKLLACHASYFGPFLSVAWSADGRFLLTTGCDDLVSIYHPRDSGGGGGGGGFSGHFTHGNESRLVARCVGHSSWVRNVAFDPYRWREGDRTYRFGSVGEDGRLLLWDFSSASLSRPKHTTSTRPAGRFGGAAASTPATFGGALLDRHRQSERRGSPSVRSARDSYGARNDVGAEHGDGIFHPAPARQSVAQLNPIASYQASTLSSVLAIRFRPSNLLLYHSNGFLQTFSRPMARVLHIADDDIDDDVAGDGAGTSDSANQSDAAGEKRRRRILGSTFSRGMRWVGGNSGHPGQSLTASGGEGRGPSRMVAALSVGSAAI
ncbi:unnamed protein product [Parajaminaea phylloscopi]